MCRVRIREPITVEANLPQTGDHHHNHGSFSCDGNAASGVGITSSTKSGTGAVSDQIMVAPDMAAAEVTADKLDECNGIFSSTPEFQNGIYHYVLPNTTDEMSSIRCFHGKVDSPQIRQMPPMMGPPDMMGPPPIKPAKKP